MSKIISEAILDRHPSNWTVWFELRMGTGFGGTAEQKIDAFAMHEWPSEQFHRVAYEIKVSRGDFLRELRKPEKRRPALRYSNEFYFITPPNIANFAEIPADCGLIEVAGDGSAKVMVKAPWRDSIPPTWRFVAAFLRRAKEKYASNENDPRPKASTV